MLDFGLAKIIERRQPVDSSVDTALITKSGPGVIMGTAAYMSPEQARGNATDHRTDIWSLGVVLYEMICGCSPFAAASSNEIISAIFSKEPTSPMNRSAQGLPESLEEIVGKALIKNRDERYQTSKDLLIDLKRLLQLLQFKANASLSTAHSGMTAHRITQDGDNRIEGTRPTQPLSSAEYIVNEIKSHRRLVLAATATFALIVSGILVYSWGTRQTTASTEPAVCIMMSAHSA